MTAPPLPLDNTEIIVRILDCVIAQTFAKGDLDGRGGRPHHDGSPANFRYTTEYEVACLHTEDATRAYLAWCKQHGLEVTHG